RDRETHEPHPISERSQHGGGRLQRQSCLPGASRSGQGHEPAVPERVEYISELGATPDERIDRRGQIVRSRERAQWREVALERCVRELPDTELTHVLEVVTAEIHCC